MPDINNGASGVKEASMGGGDEMWREELEAGSMVDGQYSLLLSLSHTLLSHFTDDSFPISRILPPWQDSPTTVCGTKPSWHAFYRRGQDVSRQRLLHLPPAVMWDLARRPAFQWQWRAIRRK